jgi:hypothetical protein
LPVRAMLTNGNCSEAKPDDGTNDLNVLVQTIRTLLARGEDRELQDSYEGLYNRCMYVVCVAGKGEILYDRLKMHLEQCAEKLARELFGAKDNGWLALFVQICEWFEAQTVGLIMFFGPLSTDSTWYYIEHP